MFIIFQFSIKGSTYANIDIQSAIEIFKKIPLKILILFFSMAPLIMVITKALGEIIFQ